METGTSDNPYDPPARQAGTPFRVRAIHMAIILILLAVLGVSGLVMVRYQRQQQMMMEYQRALMQERDQQTRLKAKIEELERLRPAE